jgi:hypothetical protein
MQPPTFQKKGVDFFRRDTGITRAQTLAVKQHILFATKNGLMSRNEQKNDSRNSGQ